MNRKTVHLNSVLRLSHQVDKVKNEIKDANPLELAKEKILDSPNTCKNFKKTVAKRTEFAPQEKLYSKLTSLDITNESVKKIKPRKSKIERDPEPCLSDFHEPFHGESVPMTLEFKETKDKIADKVYRSNVNWRDEFLQNRQKFRPNQ